MPIEFDTQNMNFAKIKVIGCGGGGGNAVNRMVEYGLTGVEFYVVNTDKQALALNKSPNKVQIGEKITKGLGCGGNPAIGKEAAEESREELEEIVKGADLIFIAAGMGGGTGTGSAAVIADIAHEYGILTVAFVTMPFWFEGLPRKKVAEAGFNELYNTVDSIIKIPNDKLLEIMGKNTPLLDSFKLADDALRQGIQGLTDLIVKPALINLDFADVRSVMMERGIAHMGIGVGSGESKVLDAAKQAIMSPLLDTSIQGAKGIIFNITGDRTIGLAEIEEAVKLVQSAADPSANIFVGANVDLDLEDEAHITVIATGFGEEYQLDDKPVTRTTASILGSATSSNLYGNAAAKKEEEVKPVQTDVTADWFGDKLSNMNQSQASQQEAPVPQDLSFLEDDEPDIPVFLKKTPKRNK